MCGLGAIKRKARADAWQGIGATEAARRKNQNSVDVGPIKKGSAEKVRPSPPGLRKLTPADPVTLRTDREPD